MRVQAASVFSKRLGQHVRVEYRPIGDDLDGIKDWETRAVIAQKLERHRQLMTDIFAQLMTVGAPLQVAMKFLPKDAVVIVCDTAFAESDRKDGASPASETTR